jgi:hypothetical protein
MRLFNPSPRISLTTPTEPKPAYSLQQSFPLRPCSETNLQLLIHALALLGWREGSPPWAGDTAKIDAQVVAHAKCLGCKRKALTFHAWHRPHRGYLAVMLCQHCGHVEEM